MKVMNDDFIMSWSRKSKDKLNNAFNLSHNEEQIWMMGLHFHVRWILIQVSLKFMKVHRLKVFFQRKNRSLVN